MELKVSVEKGRWCWWWCWWRCWSEVVGGKEVEAEIAETYFVHLLLQVVWGESQGTRSVKYRKTPSPNICLKRIKKFNPFAMRANPTKTYSSFFFVGHNSATSIR